jgi:hypothetical protein
MNTKNFIEIARKNIGTMCAAIGFLAMTVIKYGGSIDITTAEYWASVEHNLMRITFETVVLVFIQIIIKQGLCEQALQRGLNTEDTTER